MNKSIEKQGVKVPYGSLSSNPDVQRQAIERLRVEQRFNGFAHLAASPLGRAVGAGFPLARR